MVTIRNETESLQKEASKLITESRIIFKNRLGRIWKIRISSAYCAHKLTSEIIMIEILFYIISKRSDS